MAKAVLAAGLTVYPWPGVLRLIASTILVRGVNINQLWNAIQNNPVLKANPKLTKAGAQKLQDDFVNHARGLTSNQMGQWVSDALDIVTNRGSQVSSNVRNTLLAQPGSQWRNFIIEYTKWIEAGSPPSRVIITGSGVKFVRI